MPRAKTDVKSKRRQNKAQIVTDGAVDLHFHGAYGIDLMTANEAELDQLSTALWREAGIAAFCPTTLSSPAPELKQAVTRLGQWIARGKHPGARPLGIHLEGPFIHAGACGAHPPGTIRPLDFAELDDLWTASQKTLKIITFAPELLVEDDLKRLVEWSHSKKIRLSLGHSRATEVQARRAFTLGVKGVTHAWNALPFHHRAPGPLGAALGRKDTYVEIIPDLVHVHPVLIRWTLQLHPCVCFISDCVPAAGTPAGSWHAFGRLRVHFSEGAGRLQSGELAGGGRTLTDSFGRWISQEAEETGVPISKLWRKTSPLISLNPLKALGVPRSQLSKRRIRWKKVDGRWHASPAKSDPS